MMNCEEDKSTYEQQMSSAIVKEHRVCVSWEHEETVELDIVDIVP